MVFAVSSGKLLSVHKPAYQAPSALRLADDLTMDYATLYRKQGSVRTVIDFLARNIGQLSLHTFRRIDDTDRERVRDHPFAQLMSRPNAYTTGYRLFFSLVADRGIYDRALWLKSVDSKTGANELIRVPPRLWKIADGESWLNPQKFVVEGSKGKTTLDPEQVVYFRGYNPEDERYGLSPIESLRRMLSEEWAAGVMREQILRNGARVSGYIKRPAGAEWSDQAYIRFKDGWRGQYSGHSATEGGGTPVLEDGMEFIPASQTAADLQYIEARKLSREETAAAYFIPPPMVGILDHATFGNIEEQHKMLYQDTLGPWLQDIQQELALQLLPDFPDSDGLYSEFNMLEKLRGSFEEQAQQLQTSVGAPFLTRNEARARLNLPRIEGADELVVPLNVLVGGQASPTDSAPEKSAVVLHEVKRRPAIESKARAPQTYIAKAREVLAGFFDRQARAVLSELGAKDPEWWDGERWDRELTVDLFALSASVSANVARQQLAKLGIDQDEYDEDRTLAYLQKVAAGTASSINAATRIQLETALEEGGDPAHVFDVAKTARSEQAGRTIVTTLAGFASVEAVEQVRGTRTATKTWVVTSSNPRASHAAMAGETVPLDSVFSNGAKWPGDSSALDVDEVAGCSCDVDITFE